ncbi:MAG: Gfo/Idh/MocA family oxidoreductase [Planctomycetota bacterium]|nr:Gfo/Idh/MocA family oxidoreductase [Planctomycetota bacterium]
MTRPIRLALVGCGSRGTYLASLFKSHPLCRVTTLLDQHRAAAERAAGKLGLPDARIETDFDALLRDAPVDALLITSNPMTQADLACRAMERGKHACTEVPAAFTIDDCWRLVETVKKTGCKYQLMEQTRYWGFVDAWLAMRRRGELGHVCFVQGEYIHYESHWNFWTDPQTGEQFGSIDPPEGRKTVPTWRQTCFVDPIYYLPHTLSPLLKILEDRVVRVSCMGTRLGSHTHPTSSTPVRDIEYALMHTAKDTVMSVGAGFTLPYIIRGALGAHWYELRGTNGSVESPRCPEDKFRRWRRGEKTYTTMELSSTPLDADASQAASGHGGADFKPVDSFLRAIDGDTTPPLDAVLAAEITAPAVLAAESARRGGVALDVPDFRAEKRG